MDQPLFGETRPRVKIFNIVIAAITAIVVTATVIIGITSSILLHPHKCKRLYNQRDEWFCVYPMDICLCVVIILLLIPQIVVAYWYRRGELEPKFRTMIYYNAAVTFLLCVTANLYFLEVGYPPSPPQTPRLPNSTYLIHKTH